MKNRTFVGLITAITTALIVSGCANPKGAYSGKIEDDRVAEGTAGGSSLTGAAVSNDNPSFSASAPLIDDDRKDPTSLLSKRIIYFDYDKSIVREEDKAILHAHAEFLSRNASLGAVLSGNTDERGSNEYNLALGQRRADAVRDFIAAYGVSPSQLESISFGEEKPRASGQNESAWQENRRVEIRYNDE